MRQMMRAEDRDDRFALEDQALAMSAADDLATEPRGGFDCLGAFEDMRPRCVQRAWRNAFDKSFTCVMGDNDGHAATR